MWNGIHSLDGQLIMVSAGCENLSLIPGTVGAAPVQNIGAYGVEAKDTIELVRAVSVENGSVREFRPE